MSISAFVEGLLTNQIAAGFGAAAVMTWVGYQIRKVPAAAFRLIIRNFTSELVVHSNDPAFQWIEAWLARHPYSKRSHRVRLSSNDANRDGESEWTLSPGGGNHLLTWNGRRIIFERELNPSSVQTNNGLGKSEQFSFRTFGKSQSVLRELVAEAKAAMTSSRLVRVCVWRDFYWAPIRGKEPRPLNSIVLPNGQRERIIEDIQRYIGAAAWYVERGIPYRRGYLFSGPPGTGKTSLVLAIAGHLGVPVCVLNIGSVRSDDRLLSAIIEAPHNAIIVMEDIDCIKSAASREQSKNPASGVAVTAGTPSGDDEPEGVTKAGLLNALDGVATPDGRIFVMTTNYPDRLDEALIRPGRADVHVRFELLGAQQQLEMAARFYGADAFEPLPFSVSPAAMQAAFLRFPDNADIAREAIRMECKQDLHCAA